MSERTYTTGTAHIAPFPWNLEPLFGGGSVNYFDDDDTTAGAADRVAPQGQGVYADDDCGAEVSFTDDGLIPTDAVINSVTQRTRISAPGSVGWYTYPYQRRPGIGTVAGAQLAYAAAAANKDTTWTADVQGAAFTKAVLFQTRFGVGNDWYLSNAAAYVAVHKLSIIVAFTLPAPVVTTEEAQELTGTSAQLVGTLNPAGANATYPVSYYFEYGTDPSLTSPSSTTPVTGQVGSADIDVTETVTGLTGGTWYYRLVATNADQTIYGDIKSFTLSVSADAFVLDEFLIATSSPGFASKDSRSLVTMTEFAVQLPFPCNREEILEDVT